MSRYVGKFRTLAGKLFTPSEISRFNAFCNRFQDKYLKLETYKWTPKKPNWMNVRYFAASSEYAPFG